MRLQYALAFFLVLHVNAFALEHLGVYGRVYPIREESILEKIKNGVLPRISKSDIEEKLRRATAINLSLPAAKALRVEEEEIIYTVPRDIKVGDTVIAKKGEKVNVLERIQLQRVYVFLDDYMIKDFLEFAKKYPTTFLITKGDVYELRAKHPDLSIYMAIPLIVKRLNVKAVPTIVYQSGTKLVKVEIPWAEGKALLPF